jgi:Protein of unknown function (DUF1638)
MTHTRPDRLLLLGCGILKKEIKLLIQRNNWPLDTFYLDSMLHMDFALLASALKKALDNHASRQVLVMYGSCHPLMDRILTEAGARQMAGQNCVEMLLGKELFTRELSGGAYFLVEEWAQRWEQMISKTFGDNLRITRSIFQGDHSNLLCLRTPSSGDFTREAQAASNMVGLPLRWLDVNHDSLEQCLLDQLQLLKFL